MSTTYYCASSSSTIQRFALEERRHDKGSSGALPHDFDIVSCACQILKENSISSSTNLIEEETSGDNILPTKGWISFAVSLFPNARYFTKEERLAFEDIKNKRFKRFKLEF